VKSATNTAQIRYKSIAREKADGAIYTPPILADFVAQQIARTVQDADVREPLRILDPATGDGELLLSLLAELNRRGITAVEVHGFETDSRALNIAIARIRQRFPQAQLHLTHGSFLEFVIARAHPRDNGGLFELADTSRYDLVIANPPYVRTQIMGAEQAAQLAQQFGLAGRIDLYYAFIVGMAHVLRSGGIAGIIVSNRFMTTKSGAPVRRAIREQFKVLHVWDLGDTKLFDAAVLPAVLLVERQPCNSATATGFTSIYTSADAPILRASDAIAALELDGVAELDDGRRFAVRHGKLDASGAVDAVWRMATADGDSWLATVAAHTWLRFGDLGKVRVGVKTCADKVFIRDDWNAMPASSLPEALRPLITHHVARRFRALESASTRQILYPHESVDGRSRAVDLAKWPRTQAYLERHREALARRDYVIEAGREWYEIWVPQDPAAWNSPKLVFRDIAETPTFWIDLDGSVVNGDCYWLTLARPEETDLLWLAAAVANSTFIESFYDHSFNNKLYSGRRRFITQYVEKFPLPDPSAPGSERMILLAKRIYDLAGRSEADALAAELDGLVWTSFGVAVKETGG
jgi:hypothetical protein